MSNTSLSPLETLRQRCSEATKDMKLNLQSVLTSGSLGEAERFAIALSSAYFCRDAELAGALLVEAGNRLSAEQADDAKAAASIMSMNTVYYRFRHMIGKDVYQHLRAGLRMQRIVKPASTKAIFELCSMACAALAGCEACLKSHEQSLLHEGLKEDQIHDAIRIAAVINGFSASLVMERGASS